MRVFITNQIKLAAVAGITPQYLSTIKTKGACVETADKMAELTGAPSMAWMLPTKYNLKKHLKCFFSGERDSEHIFYMNQGKKK